MSGPIDSQRITSLLSEFHSFEPGARERAVLALQQIDREPSIGIMAGLLTSPDPELRCDAAEGLLRVDPKRTLDLVLPLLADPNSAVRWNTCGLLHDFGDARAVPSLISVLTNDSEADVRLMAAFALETIGDTSALPALRRAAQLDEGTDREGRRVCDAATEAIEKISSGQSTVP